MRFTNVLKFVIKFLLNRKFMTLLVLIVSIVSFILLGQMITYAFTGQYHAKEIEDKLSYGIDKTCQIQFPYKEETSEFRDKVNQLIAYGNTLEGVKGCGYYDFSSANFTELANNKSYIEKSKLLYKDTPYGRHPESSQVLFVMEGISDLCRVNVIEGSDEFKRCDDGALPLLVGYEYKDIVPIGTELTNEDTGTKYKVTGVMAKGSKWLGDVDYLGTDTERLDNKFVAMYDPEYIDATMSVLSSLDTCFCIVEDGADIKGISDKISAKANELKLGVFCKPVRAVLAEYEAPYKADMGLKVLLAVMFTFFSILSVSSSETVSILFRRPEYGIMYANGMSTADIIKMVVAENILVVTAAFIVAYGWESYSLLKDTSPFRTIRLSIHRELVSVYLLAVAAVIVAISCIVPIAIIKRLKPVELIKGRE